MNNFCLDYQNLSIPEPETRITDTTVNNELSHASSPVKNNDNSEISQPKRMQEGTDD